MSMSTITGLLIIILTVLKLCGVLLMSWWIIVALIAIWLLSRMAGFLIVGFGIVFISLIGTIIG